jgi:hypothetical protein
MHLPSPHGPTREGNQRLLCISLVVYNGGQLIERTYVGAGFPLPESLGDRIENLEDAR